MAHSTAQNSCDNQVKEQLYKCFCWEVRDTSGQHVLQRRRDYSVKTIQNCQEEVPGSQNNPESSSKSQKTGAPSMLWGKQRH